MRVPARALILIVWFVVCSSAVADTGWLNEVSDCESFQREVTKFYRSIGENIDLDPKKKAEINQVITEACGPRFRHCEFRICKRDALAPIPPTIQTTTTQTPTTQTTATQATITQTTAPLLTVPVISRTITTSASNFPPPGPVFTTTTTTVSAPVHAPQLPDAPAVIGIRLVPEDPYKKILRWLRDDLSCKDYREILRIRYKPESNDPKIVERRRRELKAALDVACSRFPHCNFAICPKGVATVTTTTTLITVPPTTLAAGTTLPEAPVSPTNTTLPSTVEATTLSTVATTTAEPTAAPEAVPATTMPHPRSGNPLDIDAPERLTPLQRYSEEAFLKLFRARQIQVQARIKAAEQAEQKIRAEWKSFNISE